MKSPLQIVEYILLNSNSFELLGMTIKCLGKEFEKLAHLRVEKYGQDPIPFFVHFVKLMSDRLHSYEWSDNYNKLEKYLRPQLENFIIDLFMSTDRQSINHFMKSLN